MRGGGDRGVGWGGVCGGRMINGQQTTCDFSCPEAKQCVLL